MIRTLSCMAIATPRTRLSTKKRAAIFDSRDGICCICEHGIDPIRERWIIEHPIPLALGGADDDGNRAPAHEECGQKKTAVDVAEIRHADRRRARHTGAKAPPRNPIPGSRSHPAKQRKRMDGSVESRDAYEARRAARKLFRQEIQACC